MKQVENNKLKEQKKQNKHLNGTHSQDKTRGASRGKANTRSIVSAYNPTKKLTGQDTSKKQELKNE